MKDPVWIAFACGIYFGAAMMITTIFFLKDLGMILRRRRRRKIQRNRPSAGAGGEDAGMFSQLATSIRIAGMRNSMRGKIES